MNSLLEQCGIRGNKADVMMRQATDAAMTPEIEKLTKRLQTEIKKKRGKSYPIGPLTAAEVVAALGEWFNKHPEVMA